MCLMPKETRLNLRISDEFRDELEHLAAYHGLKLSSYAHSLLIKAVRREKEATPEAFGRNGSGETSVTKVKTKTVDIKKGDAKPDDEIKVTKRRKSDTRKNGRGGS
jgi:hypothetical protein